VWHGVLEDFGRGVSQCSKAAGFAGLGAGAALASLQDYLTNSDLSEPTRVGHAIAAGAANVGGALAGAGAGAALCVEFGPGAILCAGVGAAIGSGVAGAVVQTVTDNTPFVPMNAGGCGDFNPDTGQAGTYGDNGSFSSC